MKITAHMKSGTAFQHGQASTPHHAVVIPGQPGELDLHQWQIDILVGDARVQVGAVAEPQPAPKPPAVVASGEIESAPKRKRGRPRKRKVE